MPPKAPGWGQTRFTRSRCWERGTSEQEGTVPPTPGAAQTFWAQRPQVWGGGVGLLSGPSAAKFWVRPGPELRALHTVFGAQESVAPGRYAPAWRLGTGSLQSDHSRPQGEVVGTSGTRRGAGCELSADHQHLSRRSARARDPAPLWVLTQTPWGPGDRRLWGVARRSRGAPQCRPPTRGDLNATSPPNTRPPTRRATLLQATPGVSPAGDSEAGRGSPSRHAPPPGLRSGLPPGSRSLFRFAQRSPWPPGSSQTHCAGRTEPRACETERPSRGGSWPPRRETQGLSVQNLTRNGRWRTCEVAF